MPRRHVISWTATATVAWLWILQNLYAMHVGEAVLPDMWVFFEVAAIESTVRYTYFYPKRCKKGTYFEYVVMKATSKSFKFVFCLQFVQMFT